MTDPTTLGADAASPEPETTPTPAEPTPESSPPATPAPETPDDVARQRDEYYDLLLRKTAEFDNYRKRTDRERRELADYAASNVLGELLPVVDDLERALAALTDDTQAETYRAGVELIHKQMLELLSKHGVTPLEAIGKPFDPNFHQAVAREIGAPTDDGIVLDEFRRGYMLGDRLLRAAMVKVGSS